MLKDKLILSVVIVPIGILIAGTAIFAANSCPIGEYPLSTGSCIPDNNYISGSITNDYIQQLQQQISQYQTKLAQDQQALADDQYKLDNSKPDEASKAAGACNLDWNIPRGGCDALFQQAQQAAADWNYANSHIGLDRVNVNQDNNKLDELNAKLNNANAFMTQKNSQPVKQNISPVIQPAEPKSNQLEKPKQQNEAEQNNVEADNSESSEILLEAVLGKHKDEVAAIKQYYNKPPLFKPATDAEYAQNSLDQTRPFGIDVVNAKNDYENALDKGSNKSKIADLKNSYDVKLQDLKTQLQDILTIDNGNSDALWQLGTLFKWEGDNKQSYENYRNALMAQKSKNPFKYQKLLDSVNNPAIRMELLQSMQPNENIIEIPTTETSPFLAGLKSNLDALVQPLTSAKKVVAENIEKISRAFSFSTQVDKITKELGITQ